MDSTTVAVVNQMADWKTILGGGGVTALLAVFLFRLLPVVEAWIRLKTGHEAKHDRRETDHIPERINGNPCALHQPLMDTLVEMKEDNKMVKQSVEAISSDLFGRMNGIEKDVSWIRGKLDRD